MQESVSMNARKCVHAQKPYPSQAFAHELNKGGGRGKREEEEKERKRKKRGRGKREEEEKERKSDRKDRGQEADGKKGKTKHIWGTKTRPA